MVAHYIQRVWGINHCSQFNLRTEMQCIVPVDAIQTVLHQFSLLFYGDKFVFDKFLVIFFVEKLSLCPFSKSGEKNARN